MKSIKSFTMLSVGAAALVFQYAAMATAPSAGGSGNVAVQSSVGGSISVGSNGSALSYAQNSEAATAKVTATTGFTPYHKAVTTGIAGDTTTQSSGQAYNISSGTGTGSATSAGSATTLVKGATAIHGVSNGFSGGSAGAHTTNFIQAGASQGSFVAGETASGFSTELNYSRSATAAPAPAGYLGGSRSAQVGISTHNTGYASGTNASGALENMNAAGIANIGAWGHFFAKGGLTAATGTVTAP